MKPMPNAAAPVSYQPIGHVRSPYTTPAGMPLQTAAALEQPVQIELDPAYLDGLQDIEGFDHLWLFTHLHLARTEPLQVTPFLDTRRHGVFATRSPARPNRIGLSLVRLLRVDGCTLHCAGNDMVDGTPVLDIKPYVPRFDVREAGRIGWFAERLQHLERARADGRMNIDTRQGPGPR